MKRFVLVTLIVLAVVSCLQLPVWAHGKEKVAEGSIKSPEEFLGFQPGSDLHLADWEDMVAYFSHLSISPKIKVENWGESTEGRPWLVAYISAPQNLAHLDELRDINKKIHDPGTIAKAEAEQLIKKGKVVVLEVFGMHSTECVHQAVPDIAYEMLTSSSDEVKRILEDVVFIMVPCFNPDGLQMVCDWYDDSLGEAWEGENPPSLYHVYGGHDDNRDAYQHNMVESKYLVQLGFKDWPPQVFYDHHTMGNSNARMFVPAYGNPMRTNVHPLVWREMALVGAHITTRLEEEGRQGIISNALYPAWANTSAFYRLAVMQNTVGFHTETANAKLATPIEQDVSNLGGGGPPHQFVDYIPMPNFPNPWPGGEWRLMDMVTNARISALSTLEWAATYKDTILRNCYEMGKQQTENGAAGSPKVFLIPPEQHDPLTAGKLVQLLIDLGIEVREAITPITADGTTYPVGTYALFLAQPKMGLIKTLIEQTLFPDNYWTRADDGKPYTSDSCTDTMNEFMGVTTVTINDEVQGSFAVVGKVEPVGVVTNGTAGYVVDGRLNDSFAAVNSLLRKGAQVWRLDSEVTVDDTVLPPGAFYIEKSSIATSDLDALAAELGVDFFGVASVPTSPMHQVTPLRIGLFQRYYGGNADEGWTQCVFDQFGFEFTTIRDADILAGDLRDRIDVLVIPSDSKSRLVNPSATTLPPEYRSGMGVAGMQAVKAFVEAGGRLVAFENAWQFAVDSCGLSVASCVAGKPTTEYYAKGSTLKATVDNTHPLAYGMPSEAFVYSWTSPVFTVTGPPEEYETIVTYAASDVLQSGWLIGEDLIKGKPAMVSVRAGDGQVVLIGFKAQNRAQTHGTYKLIFNCLY